MIRIKGELKNSPFILSGLKDSYKKSPRGWRNYKEREPEEKVLARVSRRNLMLK